MSFISRAEAMIEQGEHFRAFIHLLSGIRTDPTQSAALDTAIDIYIGFLTAPGVERDLLRVLDVVPNGIDLYEYIEGHLNNDANRERYIALREVRRREGLVQEPQPVVRTERQQAPPRQTEVEVPQQRAAMVQPRAVAPLKANVHERPYDDHYSSRGLYRQNDPDRYATGGYEPVGPYDESAYNRQRQSAVFAPADPLYPPPPQERWTPVAPLPPLYDLDDESLHERETATTGMFSSIDGFLDDSTDLLEEELRAKSKRRAWLFGAIALAIIALILLFMPVPETVPPANNYAQPIPAGVGPSVQPPPAADDLK